VSAPVRPDRAAYVSEELIWSGELPEVGRNAGLHKIVWSLAGGSLALGVWS